MSWNFLCVDMFPCDYSKTVSVCPYPERRNRTGFVNISPTLVIDTSMERSSRVLQHGNPKIFRFFFKKIRNWILTCIAILTFAEELESPWLRQYQSNIGNWYINRKVFTSTTPWKHGNTKIWTFSKNLEKN